jgi:hypothetical protein
MRREVLILDKRAERRTIAAVVDDRLPWHQVVAAETAWEPLRRAKLGELGEAEGTVLEGFQHLHWSWMNKIGQASLLAYRFVGVECEGEVQGLMLVDVAMHQARAGADAGKPIAYVDYLECAPWNLPQMCDSPRFGTVGTRLIEAAIRVSRDEGFGGRIGLHALPQAEEFYRDECGMEDMGPDASYGGMRYFEMLAEAADGFLPEGEK